MGKKGTAIVLAAGQGRRMGTATQKQFLDVNGKPLLYYSLRGFQESPLIQEIILVTGEDKISFCRDRIVEPYGFTKVSQIIPGGEQRYDSVYEGLKHCANCDYVFIHDGARPFVTEEILNRAWEEVQQYQACAVGVPAKDTIKITDGEGFGMETPARSSVWQVQTPQVFSYSLIRKAYDLLQHTDRSQVTDDSMVVEHMLVQKVHMTMGDYRNIKVTTPEDLPLAEVFFKKIKKFEK